VAEEFLNSKFNAVVSPGAGVRQAVFQISSEACPGIQHGVTAGVCIDRHIAEILVIGFKFQAPVLEGLHIISQNKMMTFRKAQIQVIIIV
jgi:hypothetical protein